MRILIALAALGLASPAFAETKTEQFSDTAPCTPIYAWVSDAGAVAAIGPGARKPRPCAVLQDEIQFASAKPVAMLSAGKRAPVRHGR